MSATSEQKIASNPAHNVWVNASAGTGKTKVLTDRVLRLMLDGIEPDKILCLTFTNAAAAEMSNRISLELSKWVIASDAELTQNIQALTEALPDKKTIERARKLFTKIVDNSSDLKIQTLHSFCQSLLKRFPIEANLTPHFTLIDEKTSAELIRESWFRILSKSADGGDNDAKIKDSVKMLSCQIDDARLLDAIWEVITKRADFLHALEVNNGADNLVSAIYKKLGIEQDFDKNATLNNFRAGSSRQELIKCADIMIKGGKKESQFAQIIYEFFAGDASYEKYCSIFLNADLSSRNENSMTTKATREKHPEATQILVHEQQRIVNLNNDLNAFDTSKVTQNIIHISEAVIEIYRFLKSAKSFLDYDDLINISSKLLADESISPWIMYKLDGTIEHILIDEAQDTSLAQWQIIKSISSEFFNGQSKSSQKRTLFVVGDEKQSIYSFQGADIEAFDRMKNWLENSVINAQKSFKPVSLDLSFRSTEPILKLVDQVFNDESYRGALSRSAKNINHHAHRNKHAGLVEIWPIIRSEQSDKDIDKTKWILPSQRVSKPKPMNILAQEIAHKISDWISNKRILKSKNRPVKAGDIIILVRRRNEFVNLLLKQLEQLNINVAGSDRLLINSNIAAQDLIALGNFLLLPDDDLNLATLLKSPLFSISEDELFELSYQRGNMSIWSRIFELKDGNENYQNSFNILNDLLQRTDFITIFELYSHVIDVIGGRKKFIARMGVQINDVIDEFLTLTMDFERTHTSSLQLFIHWFNSGKTEIKRDLDSDKDEIRIMTIHGAKGLQAPIIFMPDTCSTPSISRDKILWNEGLFFWNMPQKKRDKYCSKIKKSNDKKAQDEYLRLLYVALTRAEDELYICGYQKNEKLRDECWYSLIKNAFNQLDNVENNNEILRLSSPQREEITRPNIDNKATIDGCKIPDFFYENAPKDEVLSKPLAPSNQDNSAPSLSPINKYNSYSYGVLVHKLLEILPQIEPSNRQNIAQKITEKHDSEIAKKAIKEVFAIIENPEFAELFSTHSKAEIPVTGVIADRVISGQIDRLVICENIVKIIDYKTNSPAPDEQKDIPQSYLNQLKSYKDIVSSIYPDKEVETYLLWTKKLKLMKITL